MQEELDLLQQLEYTGCDMGVVSCKVRHTMGYVTDLVEDPLQSMLNMYDSIQLNIDWLSIESSSQVRKALDCEAKTLPREIFEWHFQYCEECSDVVCRCH